MPNIIRGQLRGSATASLSLDELRENGGRLYTHRDLAGLGLVTSHDGVRKLIDSGRLPQPYRFGGRELWEGRDILAMVEEARQQPEAGGEVKPSSDSVCSVEAGLYPSIYPAEPEAA